MGDALGKIFAGFLAAIMMFLVPTMIIAQKQDDIKQNYINNAVVDFVDNARASGEIEPAAYEELCRRIDNTHMICDIDILHMSSFTIPIYDNAGTYTGTKRKHITFNKDDILKGMYPDNPTESNKEYKLKNGDYLKVKVVNVSPSLGTRMVRMFMSAAPDITLYTEYGGYVGNNSQ